MSTMTREQFNWWYAGSTRDVQPYDCYLQGREDAHLAQPAQAVDVGAIREVVAEMHEYNEADQCGLEEWADKLTRALSGEKAGTVSDGLRERAHTLVTKILSTQPPNVVLQQLEQLREARDLLSEIAASPMPGRKDYD